MDKSTFIQNLQSIGATLEQAHVVNDRLERRATDRMRQQGTALVDAAKVDQTAAEERPKLWKIVQEAEKRESFAAKKFLRYYE